MSAAAAVVTPRSPARVSVGYGPAFGVIVAATAVGFAHSYSLLTPLLGSESPESLLLLMPVVAAFVLWRKLAHAARDGAEVTVNLFFAVPLLIVLVTLFLWFPTTLSYFYGVYRLDLLAVPFFVAFAVLIFFGATALWRARSALVVLVLGWPPALDSVLRLATDRASSFQASILGLLPLPGTRIGETFLITHDGHQSAITIAAPCSGLLGVFSSLLVGGVVVAMREGPRRRKLAWLATAVGLALLGNVVRLAAVIVVADQLGIDAGFRLFHALAGPVLFAVTMLAALLLLPAFGLVPSVAGPRPPGRALDMSRGTAAALSGLVAMVAAVAVWSTGALRTPGLFGGVVSLREGQLLPLPPGYATAGKSPLASLALLFGPGAHAELAHIDGVRGDAVAAQVVVAPSYRQARRYDILDCFVFHHAHVYSTHVAPLVGGGNAILTAVRLDHADVATLTWIQPALIGGKRSWRRVLLFAYLDGVRAHAGKPDVTDAQSFGAWLLDRVGPYGTTKPPGRFGPVERGLVAMADQLVDPKTVWSEGV